MLDFWINILAGIALALASWLLFTVLVPQYLAWRYKAPRLDGQWVFFDSWEEGAPCVGGATVKQSGERIEFSSTRTRSRSGKALSRKFLYLGKVRDGQVLLTFEEPTTNGFIAGNLVLKVSGDLKSISGFTVYLDRDKGSVVAHPIVFRRA